jgi:hypothetical protein
LPIHPFENLANQSVGFSPFPHGNLNGDGDIGLLGPDFKFWFVILLLCQNTLSRTKLSGLIALV